MSGPIATIDPATPKIPDELWRQSGRPIGGWIMRFWTALLFAIGAFVVVNVTEQPVGWALAIVGVGAFFAIPSVIESMVLARYARRVEGIEGGRGAQKLLEEIRDNTTVKLFAPHGWLRVQEGKLHLALGDGRAAAKAFAEAERVSTHPGDKRELLSAQAHGLVMAGDRKEARELLSKLRKSDALSDLDHLNFGVVLLSESGHNKEALDHLEEAREAYGDQPRVLAGLILALQRCDRARDAAGLLDEAEELIEGSEDTIAHDLLKRGKKGLRPYLKARQKRERKAEEAASNKKKGKGKGKKGRKPKGKKGRKQARRDARRKAKAEARRAEGEGEDADQARDESASREESETEERAADASQERGEGSDDRAEAGRDDAGEGELESRDGGDEPDEAEDLDGGDERGEVDSRDDEADESEATDEDADDEDDEDGEDESDADESDADEDEDEDESDDKADRAEIAAAKASDAPPAGDDDLGALARRARTSGVRPKLDETGPGASSSGLRISEPSSSGTLFVSAVFREPEDEPEVSAEPEKPASASDSLFSLPDLGSIPKFAPPPTPKRGPLLPTKPEPKLQAEAKPKPKAPKIPAAKPPVAAPPVPKPAPADSAKKPALPGLDDGWGDLGDLGDLAPAPSPARKDDDDSA